MKIKQLWKGIFNFPAGLRREYAYAYTEDQARVLMIKRISKKQGVYPSFLFDWLNKHPGKYTIKLEIEFTEDEECN